MIKIIETKQTFKNEFCTTYAIQWSKGTKEYMSEVRIFEGNVLLSLHQKKVDGLYVGHNVRLGKTFQDIRNVEKELKQKVIEYMGN